MDIYAQNILDRYKNPFHKSKDEEDLSDFQIIHEEANHSCGDVVKVMMKLEEDEVEMYRFSGSGCAISMASADILGDLIDETSVDEILAISKEGLYEILGIEISIRRSKCALLALLAIQNGILAHQAEKLKSWKNYHI